MAKILKKIESKVLKNRKVMCLVLICEVLILLLAINLISQSVVLNKNDDKVIDESRLSDEVQCTEGMLSINTVSVEVQSDSNVAYNIAYAWGPDDTDYPSIPHAAIASFTTDNDAVAYDISLYKDSFVPKADIPEGKNADNWFDDWNETGDADEASANRQERVKAGDISGFLISSGEQDTGGAETSVYSVKTFYFAQKQKDGLSVYILEGILYSPDKQEAFEESFGQCMASIKR